MAKRAKKRSAGGTPKAVLDAFFPETIRVGELALQPMTMAHALCLERLESPVLDRIQESTLEDAAKAVYVLTLPSDQAMAAVADRAAFDARFAEFCARIPIAEVKGVAEKLVQQLQAAFATFIPSSPDGEPPFPEATSQSRAPASAAS